MNAAEVSAGRDFNQHIERLLRSIDYVFKKDAEPTAPSKNVEGGKAPTATSIVTADALSQPLADNNGAISRRAAQNTPG